jgi:hypothetical protein
MLTTDGRVFGIIANSVKVMGQDAQGARLLKLGGKERIIKVVGY